MVEKDRQKIAEKIKKTKQYTLNTIGDWSQSSIGTYASSITFYFFLSSIPLIILLVQLLPFVGVSKANLIAFVLRLVPETAYGLTVTVITEAYSKVGSLLPLSFLILIWSGSKGTVALRSGLNSSYGVSEKRSLPAQYLISIGYTLALLVLFVLLLFVMFAKPATEYLALKMPELFQDEVTFKLWEIVLLEVLMVLIFALIYTFIPAGRRNYFRQIPGAFLATVLWQLFSKVFSIYLKGYNAYTMFYGSLGTIAIYLFWMYCCFFILLIGGFFNRNVTGGQSRCHVARN